MRSRSPSGEGGRPAGSRRSRVRVRRRRHALELRVDGTLASSYSPGQLHTGPVWDALAAPLLVLPMARRRRVLILGLGGGSVARMSRALAPGASIVGVEHDAEVIEAARRHFDLDRLRIRAVVADALQYLQKEQGRFDAVIEDLFAGPVQHVRKPPWLPEPGYALAARHLAPGGVLTSNTIHETASVARSLGRLFGTVVSIGIAGHYNHILAAGPASLRARPLRRRFAAHPLLGPVLPELKLRTLRRRGGRARSGQDP
jgi:predicted membrane-bound spermidine synthase